MTSGLSVEEFGDVIPLSLDDLRESIEAIEADLAKAHGIKTSVRMSLMRKIINNEIVEDELVARWHQLYASLLRCAKDTAKAKAREFPEKPPPSGTEIDSEKGAAAGGLFFVFHV